MKKEEIKNSEKHQAGFSLLEVLLVVAISSVILIGAVKVTDDWAKKIVDYEEADYLTTVANAAEAFLNANFADVWVTGMGESFNPGPDGVFDSSDTVNFGRVIRIGMDNGPASGPASYYLKHPLNGTLPGGFPVSSPLGFEPRILVRDMGYVRHDRVLELYVITQSTGAAMLPVVRANNVASNIGPEGAAVSRIDSGTASIYTGPFCGAGNAIVSIYGTWQSSMDLLNPPFAFDAENAYCPAVQPGPDGRGAYVAIHRTLTFSDEILDDVLYRVAIPGRPEVNRMQANLDMNNLSIVNAGAVSADKMNVTGNFDVTNQTGTTFIEETARFAGAGSVLRTDAVPGGVSPDPNCGWDPLNSTQLDPAVSVTGTCDLKGGNLSVTAGNAASGQAALLADSISAPAASLTAGNLNVQGTLSVGNQALIANTATMSSGTAGGIASNTLTVNNTLNTSLLQSSDLTNTQALTTGGLIAGTLRANGNLNIANTLNVMKDSSGSQGVLDAGNVNVAGVLTAQQANIGGLSGCRATVIHRFDLQPDGNYYAADDFEYGVPSYDCTLGP